MRNNPIRAEEMRKLCITSPEKVFGQVVLCAECDWVSYNKFGGSQHCDHCQKTTQHKIGSFEVPNDHIDSGCDCYHENNLMKRADAEARLRNDLRVLRVPEASVEKQVHYAFQGKANVPYAWYIKEKAAVLRNLLYGGMVFGNMIGEAQERINGINPHEKIKSWVENKEAMKQVFEFLNSDICCAHEDA